MVSGGSQWFRRTSLGEMSLSDSTKREERNMKRFESEGSDSRHSTAEEVLKGQVSKSWYLLACVTVFSTIGMSVAVAPMLNERFVNIWPWANTHIVLLAGLVISMALLIIHLTVQQNRVSVAHKKVEKIKAASSERDKLNSARLRALLNISRIMGAVTDPENVFSRITNTCLEIFDCQQASLMLLNDDKTDLQVRSATGHLDENKVNRATQKVGKGIAGWVAETKQPLILGPNVDMSRYPGLQLRSHVLTAAMVVPILLRGEIYGVLNISSRSSGVTYDEDDLQALQVFAENAGTVIRHSEQAEWMRKMIEKHRVEKASTATL
jgi:putative methionine-R-sulfoxide reductase with GAF domain